ncbi:hypothetical protein DWV69_07365 [Clostridium sp. AF12-19]|nr:MULTISPECIES: tetratricopeptide repeat protein [unclassified Clostridium]RHS23833.1 hypothetical protein DWV71_10040 [Clostridium sp. AF12-28]RHS27983.1 hypothetical protein DWV69_07365 [Clostridium sp. AF12-19]
MRKWFLIMAAAVMLCSACGRKDASVNGATQEAQASSTEAESLYKEGTQYIGEEDYESAIESLLKCIELDPNYSKAYIQLSKAYIGYEEYDEALAILQQGYEKTKDASLEKEQDNCVRSICQVLTDNEDYETAIPWLVKLQEIDGITVENSLQLAEAYSMMDDYENAVKILQNADQNDESIKNALLEARINYGQYCYDEGMNDQAIETLKAVINEAPDRIEAYSMLITVYVDAGKVKEAEGIVQSGLERFVNQNSTVTDDQLDEFLNSASSYYLELEDMDACLKFWEKAASMRPGNKNYKEELDSYRSAAADESYAKADELLEAGNVEGASKYYKRAFALAPANYDAGVISGGDYTYCLNKDGSWRLGWYTDETGGSYYFNPAAGRLYASAVTGYQQLDGAVYYFEDDGRMLVDDTTPDGRFADVDGKLLDHNPYEDASEEETDASEEETETDEEETAGEETTGASVKETTAAMKEPVKETTKANPQPTQAAAVNSGNLKLNADTLQEASDKGGTTTYEKEELFDGSTGKLTMGDVYSCLSKYGKTEWVSQKLPYELKVGNLKVWILPGDNWNTTGLVIKDASQYFDVLKKKALPDNVQFAVEFDSSAADKLSISKVRSVNGN